MYNQKSEKRKPKPKEISHQIMPTLSESLFHLFATLLCDISRNAKLYVGKSG